MDAPMPLIAPVDRRETPLPEWLTGAPPVDPATTRPLLEMTFANLFEHLVDKVTLGRSIASILKADHRNFTELERAAFLRWVYRNADLKRRLSEAQEIGAEVTASEIPDIADNAIDSGMASTQIAARKWMAGVNNRKRFGERTDVNISNTIDIRAVIERASMRVIEHEAAPALEHAPSDGG